MMGFLRTTWSARQLVLFVIVVKHIPYVALIMFVNHMLYALCSLITWHITHVLSASYVL